MEEKKVSTRLPYSMDEFNWETFQRCRDTLQAGKAEEALQALRKLRQKHAEPAIATVMADALLMLNRPEEARSTLESDIAQGVDNHWTHYTLGHHHAMHGDFTAAAAAFNCCHAHLGWMQSLERGYTFSHDYFSGHIQQWKSYFSGPIDQEPIEILEIGSWQGGSTLWLLDNVIGPRGGHLTCVDTWEGSSEHTFLETLNLSIEEFFDRNVALTGMTDKITKIKGYSQDILTRLEPKRYDLIYIDGAHEAKFAIQDAVLAHRLVRDNGFLLFDDYHYSFKDSRQNTKKAINFFTSCFHEEYLLIHKESQVLLKKINNSYDRDT